MPIKPIKLLEKFCLLVDCLDYKYIEKCSNIKEIENILRVLRSGEEGVYPHLIKFCEHRLQELSPHNKLLRIQGCISSAANFPHEEWKKLQDDMEDWVKEINEHETILMAEKNRKIEELYQDIPIRNISPLKQHSEPNEVQNLRNKSNSRKIKSYKEWDECNVEEQLKEIDAENVRETVTEKVKPCSEFSVHVEGFSETERKYIAENEKVKGNDAFKVAEYKEAFMYYSRSISAFPTIAAYNNRAQANIKLKNYGASLFDCNKVLQMDPNNIKALFRRGIAYKEKGALIWACKDFRKLLLLEPENKFAKNFLEETERCLISKNSKDTGTRVLIEEIDECNNEALEEKKSIFCSRLTPKETISSIKETDENEAVMNAGALDSSNEKFELSNGSSDQYSSNLEIIDINLETTVKGKSCNSFETQTLLCESMIKFEGNNNYMLKESEYAKEDLLKDGSETSENEKMSEISENSLNEEYNKEHCNNKRNGNVESNDSISSTSVCSNYSRSSNNTSGNISDILKARINDTDDDSENSTVVHSVTTNEQIYYMSQTVENCIESAYRNEYNGEARNTLESNKDNFSVITDCEHGIIIGEHHNSDSQEPRDEVMVSNDIKNVSFNNSHNEEACANDITLSREIQMVTEPITPFEFLYQWHSEKVGKNCQKGAELLNRIKPNQLPTILTNKLDGDFLSEIINAVSYLVQSDNYERGYAFLCCLAKVPRISTVALFMSPQEKEEINMLCTQLVKQGLHQDATNIKEKFCLN